MHALLCLFFPFFILNIPGSSVLQELVYVLFPFFILNIPGSSVLQQLGCMVRVCLCVIALLLGWGISL